MQRMRLQQLLLLWGWVALAGCQAKPTYPLVPVSGVLTYKGQPCKNITIQLLADARAGTHAPTATGQTQADGSFTLQTPTYGAGAAPGHYKVTLQQYGGTPAIPSKYANPATTPLRIEVPEGGLAGWELKLDN